MESVPPVVCEGPVVREQPSDEFSWEIVHHLPMLKTEWKHYFLDVTGWSSQSAWWDRGTKGAHRYPMWWERKHKECCPINFWVTMASSHLTLTSHCSPAANPPWEDELGFPVMMNFKSKSRNCLAVPRYDFLCAVSKVRLCICQFVEKKQLHSVH